MSKAMLASATSRTAPIKDRKNGPQPPRMSTFRGIMNARSTAQRQPDAAVPISLQAAHANTRRTLIRVFPDAETAAQADVAGKA
ncbi:MULTISPECIES: hypothetical protein [Burkholderia cepacia complex]|uniref:hypothetical protein n=1 Tax=Burkholderia cepacia complex TaxID=87882 RepID=UPI0012BAD1E8|nr:MULTISPECIES: hypothetical protein [Burkholderia cepacia complex]